VLGDRADNMRGGGLAAASLELAYWFEPSADQPTALVFLPSPDPGPV